MLGIISQRIQINFSDTINKTVDMDTQSVIMLAYIFVNEVHFDDT